MDLSSSSSANFFLRSASFLANSSFNLAASAPVRVLSVQERYDPEMEPEAEPFVFVREVEPLVTEDELDVEDVLDAILKTLFSLFCHKALWENHRQCHHFKVFNHFDGPLLAG